MNHPHNRPNVSRTAAAVLGVSLAAASACASDESGDTGSDDSSLSSAGGSSAGGSQSSGGSTVGQGTAGGTSSAGTSDSTTTGTATQGTSTNGGGAATGGTSTSMPADTGGGGAGGMSGAGGTGGAGEMPGVGAAGGAGGIDGAGEMDEPGNSASGGSMNPDADDSSADDSDADDSDADDMSGEETMGAAEDPAPSAGCGQAPPASDTYTIDVSGTSRDYILAVPDNYDPEKAYRLIFAWHPWGGSAQQVAGNGPGGYYGLLGASGGEAILVSPEGLDFGGNGLGWGNEGGQDIEFLRAMIDRFDGELCFDHNRKFSTGFSFGGMMSNAVACAGLARAVAPMAGNSQVAGCEDGSQPVAYMGFHGDADTVVSLSGGETARDVFVGRNGCGAGMPSDSDWCDLAGGNYQPCSCTTYEGCTEGYPVTWCQFTGGHAPAPNSGETIWNFFSQF